MVVMAGPDSAGGRGTAKGRSGAQRAKAKNTPGNLESEVERNNNCSERSDERSVSPHIVDRGSRHNVSLCADNDYLPPRCSALVWSPPFPLPDLVETY